MLNILLVDDEPSIRLTVGDALRSEGYNVTLAGNGAEAASLIDAKVYDVVVTDIRMPQLDGLQLFARIREQSPNTAVIIITAYGDVTDAVKALKMGAHDYLTKPFDNEEILLRVGRIAEQRAIQDELAHARTELAQRGPNRAIIGQSPPMLQLLKRIDTIGASDAPVLITGESGTGKELVARSLHALSPRAEHAFVAVNCAAFPETLLEAELFGHERGAFTGATRRREGRFQAANNGTLFLDEIAEIPPMAQAKLLRVLQEGHVEPLGTNTFVQVDVRIISATHRNLKERIRDGSFREDLYYRLNVLDLPVPPLRERHGDLPVLVEYFNKRYALDGEPAPISPRAWAALSEYGFPGNVRELEHAIQHAVVLSRGREIDLEHLPADIAGSAAPAAEDSQSFRQLSVAIKEFEREYLLRGLSLAGGRRGKAADLLGISRKNLWEKLRAHGVTQEEIDH